MVSEHGRYFACRTCLPGATSLEEWIRGLAVLPVEQSDNIISGIYMVATIDRARLQKNLQACRELEGSDSSQTGDSPPSQPRSRKRNAWPLDWRLQQDVESADDIGWRSGTTHEVAVEDQQSQSEAYPSTLLRFSHTWYPTAWDTQYQCLFGDTYQQPLMLPEQVEAGSLSTSTRASTPTSKSEKGPSPPKDTALSKRLNKKVKTISGSQQPQVDLACPDCGKRYRRQRDMEQHLVNHHFSSRHALASLLGLVPTNPALQADMSLQEPKLPPSPPEDVKPHIFMTFDDNASVIVPIEQNYSPRAIEPFAAVHEPIKLAMPPSGTTAGSI